MKILLVCKKFPYPPKDGETIAIFNHIKGFHRAGNAVTVAAINTVKHHFNLKELPEAIQQMAHFHATDVDASPKMIPAFFNLFESSSYHITRFVSENFKCELERILTTSVFDVIQLEGMYLAPYIETIRKYSKAPIIMRAHNVEHEIWFRIAENTTPGIKKWYLQLQAKRLRDFEISMLNRCDAMVPITARDGERFRVLGCRLPMHPSPTGINAEEYVPEKTKEEFPSAFFLGGLDWIPNQKGLKWFIENVWKRFSDKREDCKFYIAGRNAPHWITDLNVRNVIVTGEVDDARTFMNSKALMVVPLFSGSGMRIKIIEGMALGKTIISTSIGAEGIGCVNNEHILIADTAADFLNAMERCANDRKHFDAIGEKAALFAREHYDNDNLVSSLLGFYSQLKPQA